MPITVSHIKDTRVRERRFYTNIPPSNKKDINSIPRFSVQFPVESVRVLDSFLLYKVTEDFCFPEALTFVI